MNATIEQLEEKINNLANQIFALNIPLNWDEIRPNVFPNKDDLKKGYTQQRIDSFLPKHDKWQNYYVQLVEKVIIWCKRKNKGTVEVETNKQKDKNVIITGFRNIESVWKAILFTLATFDSEKAQNFIQFFSINVKYYIKNSDKKDLNEDAKNFSALCYKTKDGQKLISINAEMESDKNDKNDKNETNDNLLGDASNPDIDTQSSTKAYLNRIYDKLEECYKNKNQSSNTDHDIKSAAMTHMVISELMTIESESKLQELIDRYVFLKKSEKAILHFYRMIPPNRKQGEKGKSTVEIEQKTFSEYLGISDSALAKAKTRIGSELTRMDKSFMKELHDYLVKECLDSHDCTI